MNFDPVTIVQLVGYASLALELTVWAVPSVASSRQILAAPKGGGAATDARPLAAAQSRGVAAKLMRYGLPTGCGIVVVFLPLALIFAPDWRANLWPLGDDASPGWRWAGASCILLGRVITLLGARELRRDRLASLAESGIFAWTRNPIVVGMHVFLLGNLLIFPCLVLVGGMVLYLLYMHGRVRMEEDFLAHSFDPSYQQYRQRVPRYLLF